MDWFEKININTLIWQFIVVIFIIRFHKEIVKVVISAVAKIPQIESVSLPWFKLSSAPIEEKPEELYFTRIEPKVKQVDKDAKKTTDDSFYRNPVFTTGTSVSFLMANGDLDSRYATYFYPNSTLASATDGLVSRYASATDSLVSRYASDLCPYSALVLATRNLASRCVSENSYYYRGKSNQPRLPITYPDELI